MAGGNRQQRRITPSNTTNIQQRTFHDQVENAALEANHHVERSDIFAVKGLPSLRGALGGRISFEKAQHAVAAEKRLVLSSEEVADLDVRSAERERLRALGVLSGKLHLSDNPCLQRRGKFRYMYHVREGRAVGSGIEGECETEGVGGVEEANQGRVTKERDDTDIA